MPSDGYFTEARQEIETAAADAIKKRRRICTLAVPAAASAIAAAHGMKLHLFSASNNRHKVGSAVFVSRDAIKHAFMTSAIGMDDNFDKLTPAEGEPDFSSTENFAFGMCKGYLELYKIGEMVSCMDAFHSFVAYNADKKWLTDAEKAMAREASETKKDEFLKHLMIEAGGRAVKQCQALMQKAADKKEAGDVLMHAMIPGMTLSHATMKAEAPHKTAAQVLDEYTRFKKSFFLDHITKLLPETAKMAIGRSVIYSAIAEEWEGGLATYAVEVTRTHFLRHHPEIAYTFFMINSGSSSGGKEYSKFDDIWAQKCDKPDTPGGGALCDLISSKPEAIEKCLGFVLGTIDDDSKLLAAANKRVVANLLHMSHPNTKAKALLRDCGWEAAVNQAIPGGDVFNPPMLPEAYATCMATATMSDRHRFVERLSAPDDE
jgi:hypothetical protein